MIGEFKLEDFTSLEKVKSAQNQLVAWATGGNWNEDEYQELRSALMEDTLIRPNIPDFIKTCRSAQQFWSHMKKESETYQGRREYIWEEFEPLFEKLEEKQHSPADKVVTDALPTLEVENVQALWSRAIERRTDDPEGAITLARSLIESVCKSILDEMGEEYSDNEKITNLYHKTASKLNLSPQQHTKEQFKAILGNTQSVVTKLAEIRNDMGDAHGDGQKSYKPAPRHAELAVNLAGSTAKFLVRTWNKKS
jgi:hypothetical protein